MERETILFDVADNVATITLNRPDSLNSFNNAMADGHAVGLGDRPRHRRHPLRRAPGQRRPRLLHRASTSRAAALVHEGQRLEQLRPRRHARARSCTTRCGSRWSTAVHGFCAGGAQYFLNESDIIICSDDAVFFDPHANVGIVSALEPIGMLHRGVPLGDVLRWALMGNEERITAETALRLGLVTEVVSRDALRDRAREIALVHRPAEPQGDSGHDPGHLGVAGHDADAGPPERLLLHADRQLPVEPAAAAGQVGDPVPLGELRRQPRRPRASRYGQATSGGRPPTKGWRPSGIPLPPGRGPRRA